MTPRVVAETEGWIALEKPAGIPVIPARGAEPAEPLVAAAARLIGGKAFVVHRIDRATSGLVVFAKDALTHRRLSGLFEERAVAKAYRALVLGAAPDAGRIDRPIRAFGSGRMGVSPQGKPSLTEFRTLERFPTATLLDAFPRTGRRHQLRVHLHALGHPVLGDPLYGDARPVGGVERLMLHARWLSWPEPDGTAARLNCPPPTEFEAIVARYRAAAPEQAG